jgi:hypothetical protein
MQGKETHIKKYCRPHGVLNTRQQWTNSEIATSSYIGQNRIGFGGCRCEPNAETYAIALAFANTRACVGGLSMTLSKWRHIWHECASGKISR